MKIDGLDIFYREAGPADAPMVLLHGFPASSHRFRHLIPALADRYHVVAPDYPGFGHSSAPPVGKFEYAFDKLADVTAKFTAKVGLTKYVLYVQDNGAPVGYRLAVKNPERVTALVVQYGKPAVVWVDNGPGFAGRTLDLWAYGRRVALDLSRPGKPTATRSPSRSTAGCGTSA